MNLSANASGLSYQWIDCEENDGAIMGATDQSFTPTTSGSYAVEISDGNCKVVSDCIDVIVVGVNDHGFGAEINL